MSTTVTLTLPHGFPVLGFGFFALILLNSYQQVQVLRTRKEVGVFPPTLYVSDADAAADPAKLRYNRTQRAHQATLEFTAFIVGLQLFLGLFKPFTATTLTVFWCLGRFANTRGYIVDAKKRNNMVGRLHYVGLYGMTFTTLWVAASWTFNTYFSSPQHRSPIWPN